MKKTIRKRYNDFVSSDGCVFSSIIGTNNVYYKDADIKNIYSSSLYNRHVIMTNISLCVPIHKIYSQIFAHPIIYVSHKDRTEKKLRIYSIEDSITPNISFTYYDMGFGIYSNQTIKRTYNQGVSYIGDYQIYKNILSYKNAAILKMQDFDIVSHFDDNILYYLIAHMSDGNIIEIPIFQPKEVEVYEFKV